MVSSKSNPMQRPKKDTVGIAKAAAAFMTKDAVLWLILTTREGLPYLLKKKNPRLVAIESVLPTRLHNWGGGLRSYHFRDVREVINPLGR